MNCRWREPPVDGLTVFKSPEGDTYCGLCGDVSPAGLQDSCVRFPVAHATGRDVSAAGLNRSGRFWFVPTQAGGPNRNIRWREPPMMAFRPEAAT